MMELLPIREVKASVKLKLVDSELSTLTVNESSAKNYLTVSGKSSEIGKAKVSGNAQVLFDTPMGTIEVADTASAAKVAVHKEADALKNFIKLNGRNVRQRDLNKLRHFCF